MNTAELKLDLFRRIDNLKDSDLEKIYEAFLTLLPTSEKHTLTELERNAIEEAIEYSKMGNSLCHEAVMQEAKTRYSRLKFK